MEEEAPAGPPRRLPKFWCRDAGPAGDVEIGARLRRGLADLDYRIRHLAADLSRTTFDPPAAAPAPAVAPRWRWQIEALLRLALRATRRRLRAARFEDYYQDDKKKTTETSNDENITTTTTTNTTTTNHDGVVMVDRRAAAEEYARGHRFLLRAEAVLARCESTLVALSGSGSSGGGALIMAVARCEELHEALCAFPDVVQYRHEFGCSHFQRHALRAVC
ncbi:hypothetical protein GGR56DRAFT_558220 [Xylariaceae sp. FL0804]|nr:hypothetical protein GGR56DRAFT_558220 [Xylariaceae sp. FL0804]